MYTSFLCYNKSLYWEQLHFLCWEAAVLFINSKDFLAIEYISGGVRNDTQHYSPKNGTLLRVGCFPVLYYKDWTCALLIYALMTGHIYFQTMHTKSIWIYCILPQYILNNMICLLYYKRLGPKYEIEDNKVVISASFIIFQLNMQLWKILELFCLTAIPLSTNPLTTWNNRKAGICSSPLIFGYAESITVFGFVQVLLSLKV